MPVCHVVTFTFKEGTTDAAIDELSTALDDLASRAGAISYRHGRDLQRRAGNADYSVTAVFADYENVAIGVRDAKYPSFDIELVLQRLLDKPPTAEAETRARLLLKKITEPLVTPDRSRST